MTPAARVSAAIEILDAYLDGQSAEKCLTNWARNSRFAGSGDRHAIRDLVFDAIRRQRSYAWLSGVETGRGLMIGSVISSKTQIDDIFNGGPHAPVPLSASEKVFRDLGDAPKSVRLDIPDWLLPELQRSVGEETGAIATELRNRAPITVRVNSGKSSVENAIQMLKDEGIEAVENPVAQNALTLKRNPRKLNNSQVYLSGYVELQDASSQAVIDTLPNAQNVLDYCAGGGGKSLAMAAKFSTKVIAHDIDPKRMTDLPNRAKRAGARIQIAASRDLDEFAPFDLILCDAPCSGSGAWRRSPEMKWRITPEKLYELTQIQAGILRDAARYVHPNGVLAYATCSVFRSENEDVVDVFLEHHDDWRLVSQKRFSPTANGDGFYVAQLTKS